MSLQQRVTALAQAIGADIKQLQAQTAPAGFFRTEVITATATGQTVFTVPGGYTPGAIFVSLNGATLPPADYTATNGTTVVLADGAGIVAGSVLLIYVLSAFEVADALPLLGTAYNAARYAGLLPPPNDGKSYAIKDGSWVEVQAGGAAVWGGIGGQLADQADLKAAMDEKAEASDIDFTIIYPNGGSEASPASITTNTRMWVDNPFPGYHVMCSAEGLVDGVWEVVGWGNDALNGAMRSYGLIARQKPGGNILVKTGGTAITINSYQNWMDGTITTMAVASTIPFRVLVRKLKGAIA